MILTLTPHIVYSKVCALAQTKLNILYLLFKLVKPMSLGRNETRRKLILPRQILYFSQFHNSEFPFKMTLEKEKKEKNDGKLGHKINKSNWYFTQGYAPWREKLTNWMTDKCTYMLVSTLHKDMLGRISWGFAYATRTQGTTKAETELETENEAVLKDIKIHTPIRM